MGLLFYSFWFAPMCESSLQTVSTWVCLFNSFGLLPSVRVCCGLYSHEFTILLIWFAPMCESPLWTVFTWVYYFTLLVCSHV